MVRYLSANTIEAGNIWGFDLFQGIPADAPASEGQHVRGPRGRYSDMIHNTSGAFGEGLFSASASLGLESINATMDVVANYVNVSRPPHSRGARVHLIPGFFNVSLTSTLVHEHGMTPALYVDMDMDIYVSAFQALDWMCANGLIVNGTVIGYDDFNYGLVSEDRKGWYDGESRAHLEIEAKWGLRMRQLMSVPTTGGQSGWAFVVEGDVSRRMRSR